MHCAWGELDTWKGDLRFLAHIEALLEELDESKLDCDVGIGSLLDHFVGSGFYFDCEVLAWLGRVGLDFDAFDGAVVSVVRCRSLCAC